MIETTHEPARGPWGARTEAPAAAMPTLSAVPIIRPADMPVAGGVEFTGSRKEYARLMAWGLLLYIPTFGFYRFWLKTEQRRYLWSHMRVGGDAFEYRGTMRELVVGFLFAVAIYMPLAAAYSFAGLVAESYQTYASIPFAIFTIAFTHFASFRARRYRLTRTTFRGLRFWMRGSGWRMAFGAFLWLLLTAITLGTAYFWMQAWLERYKMTHSSYGDLHGGFDGTGWRLMKAHILPGFVLGLLATLLLFWGVFSVIEMYYTGRAGGLSMMMLLTPVALVLFIAVAWSVLSVIRLRWWIDGLRFGAIEVASTIKTTAMVGSAIKTALIALAAIVVWGVLGLFFAIRIMAFKTTWSPDLFTDLGAVIALMVWAFVALLLIMFVKAVIYNFDFMKRVAATTTLTNLQILDQVAMDGSAQGMVGEGLADALGADGF